MTVTGIFLGWTIHKFSKEVLLELSIYEVYKVMKLWGECSEEKEQQNMCSKEYKQGVSKVQLRM